MAPPDDNDPKVKDLLEGRHELDPQTQADLERWFGLPSFTQLAEQERKAAEDKPANAEPQVATAAERRNKAAAAVDPAMVEMIFARHDVVPETLIRFRAVIDVVIDPSVAQVDIDMIERRLAIGERREVQIPDQLQQDLRDCTPQALLRDLHRPELGFSLQFELVDLMEDRINASTAVAELMTTRFSVTVEERPSVEARAIFRDYRREYRLPVAEAIPLLTRRQVRE